jgi:TonB family protein
MKHCPNCKEDFADKFSFCPVDGTPLENIVSDAETSSTHSSSEGASNALVPSMGGYHLTMLEDEGLTRRLLKTVRDVASQSRLTWPEFKKDPLGFTKRLIVGYSTLAWRTVSAPNVALSAFTAVLSIALIIVLLTLPYSAIFKWLFSDGRLIANIGMPFEEVQKRSTLKLSAPQPLPQSNDGSNLSVVSSDKQTFDFEIEGTVFPWCKAYTLKIDNNDGQKIKVVDIDLSNKARSWPEFRVQVTDLMQLLKDSKWRAGTNNEGYPEDDVLAKVLESDSAPNGDIGTYRWSDRTGRLVLRLSAKVQNGKYIPHAQIEDFPQYELISMLEIPKQQEPLEKGAAGTAKGKGGGSEAEFKKPSGGGGGGRAELKPASAGKLPPASLDVPQVKAPEPVPPPIPNPSLPVPAAINADPKLFSTDPKPIPHGDPKSKSTDPSSGPGTGGGIGSGSGGGVGSGEGGGVGPGRGGNTGGGDFGAGGGGPGGGGGGDYNRIFNLKEVTTKVTILDKPEPSYTEEARKNNVTGIVTLRAVFTASGQVTGIVPLKKLPDGLTEKAIAAARQIKFKPAMKDGRAVSTYVQLQYTFTIY